MPALVANLSVRRASSSDVAGLVALMHAFYAESHFPLDHHCADRSFRTVLSNHSLGCVWLAFAGAESIGHAVLTTRYTMEHGSLSGYIDDLYVKPEHRRKGAGVALLNALITECRARDCAAMYVEVGESNAPALALYGKFSLAPAQDGRVLLSAVLRETDT
jgi:ribosomal protein S18 acetylase RimI-like enzyme